MRISDWSSDVCSSDLDLEPADLAGAGGVDTDVAGARHLRRLDRWQQPHDRHDHRAGRRPRGCAIAAARCADTVDGGEAALVSGMAHGWRPGSDVAGRTRRGERFSLCVVGDRWNGRSDARRAGKGYVITCRTRWSPE